MTSLLSLTPPLYLYLELGWPGSCLVEGGSDVNYGDNHPPRSITAGVQLGYNSGDHLEHIGISLITQTGNYLL